MVSLHEIWIYNKAGICLYNYSIEKHIDPSLFTGFLTAMNQFGQSIMDRSIQQFKFGEHLIFLEDIPEYELSIVARALVMKNEAKLKRNVKKITKIFKKLYSPAQIKAWDNDISFFEPLTGKIRGLFNE